MAETSVVPLELARHRQASIAFLESSGGYAVEARSRHKDPIDWNPSEHNEQKHKRTLDRIRNSDSNLGVFLWGTLVEVDDDSDNPFISAALDRLLPHSPHVWGRKSFPRSHRAYRLNLGREHACFDRAAWPVLDRLKKHGGVEIRGGALADGHYSLLPGSIHPSGEEYRWADIGRATSGLTTIPPDAIIGAARKAAAIGLLAHYWNDGMRNDLTMALAGFLYRLWELSKDLDNAGGDVFVMDKHAALAFLFNLMAVADDDKADEYMRKKTFLSTWQKGEDNQPITGAKRISELTGDLKIITKLYALLSDDPSISLIDQFLSRFAIWTGPGLFIDIDAPLAGKPMTSVLMNKAGFDISYAHMRYTTLDGKSKPLTARLPAMVSAIRVDGLTMQPGAASLVEEQGQVHVNLWAGFKVEPHKAPVPASDIQCILDYINDVIACRDPAIYAWVTQWIADIFQNPSDKPGTALVLVGKPGTGKSFLHEAILRPIIGTAHSVANNNIYNITRDFNALYAQKLLIACDEATSRRQKDAFEKLKTLITDKTMRVEPKGKDAYMVPNQARFILTSNYELDAVHLPDGRNDRRYMIQKVSDCRRVDIEYFTGLAAWLETPGNLGRVHRYFLDLKVDQALIRRVHATEAREALQIRSIDVFDKWLLHCIERGFPLSTTSHRDWWDAFPEGETSKIKKKGVNQDQWPNWVHYEAICADLNDFRRRHDPHAFVIDEAYIGQELMSRGLKPERKPKRLSLQNEYSNRTNGGQFSGRLWVRPWPGFEQVSGYLRGAFGYEAPEETELEEEAMNGREREDRGPDDEW